MERKKILHLISGLEIGGTETQLLRILPELEKYHSNAVCCVRGHGPIGIELEKKNIPVYYLNFKGFSDLLVIKRLYSVIKKFHPDILVTYLIHTDLYGRVFGRLFGIKKIVCSKRGALLQWEWLAFFDWLTKFMVTHYLVQTKTARSEWMNRLKLPKRNFSIIPNGIDTNIFQLSIDKKNKCKELKIDHNSFIISCVSRLRRGKGHDVLLQAFENVFKKNKNISLLIVGDGEREEELHRLVRNYSSRSNIYFLGNRTDIPEILAISNLFILPTEKEGMSNAIMEAMVMGIPIITTDISENRDIIKHKKNGLLFPIGDINFVLENIELCINNNQLMNSLGKNARKEALRKFDISIITKRFAKFYDNI